MTFQELNNLIEQLKNENNPSNKELIQYYENKRIEVIKEAFKKGFEK